MAVEEVSTITAKGQTTVPKAVRQVLGVEAGDQIVFRVEGSQVVVMSAAAQHEDPVVGKFLDLLAKDIGTRPGAVQPMSKAFVSKMRSLAKGARVNLEDEIEGDVDL
jgi:antitoxin PrlF